MKRLMKVLSMLICLAMVMSGTSVDMLYSAAFAEEGVAETVAAPTDETEPVAAAEPTVEEETEEPAEEAEDTETSEQEEETELPQISEGPEAPEAAEDPNAID